MPTCRCDPEGGFTLVELLVVIAILGLFSAGAAQVLFRSDPAFELRNATTQIETTLRRARSTALVENRDVAVVFDISDGWFGSGADRTWLPDKFQMRVIVAGREALDGQTGAIRFYPDGATTGGIIHLSDAVETHSVTVDWLTGRVGADNAAP